LRRLLTVALAAAMTDTASLLDIDQSGPALDPASLSFQDFGSSRGGGAAASATAAPSTGPQMGGAIGSSMLKPQTVDFGAEATDRPAAAGSLTFWSISYYQPLFDVDTLQVLNRIKGALLPRPKGAFFEVIAANPDLYGPFWISTTLIFTMAITGNLASYFSFTPSSGQPQWSYNFNQLTLAGSVIYAYVTLLPLLFWLLLRYFEASKKLVDVLCIYGYTLSIFLPISVLCVLPSNLFRWLLVLIGGGISAVFLLSNFHAHLADCFPYGEGDAKRKMMMLLGAMATFHFVLIVMFKVYFFHYA